MLKTAVKAQIDNKVLKLISCEAKAYPTRLKQTHAKLKSFGVDHANSPNRNYHEQFMVKNNLFTFLLLMLIVLILYHNSFL
jgi:hypothetical protein